MPRLFNTLAPASFTPSTIKDEKIEDFTQKPTPRESNSVIMAERKAISKEITTNLTTHESLLNQYSLLNNLKTKPSVEHLLHLFKSEKIDPIKALALTSLSYSASKTSYEGWNLSETAQLYSAVFDSIQAGEGVFSKSISKEVCSNVAQLKNSPRPQASTLQALALETMHAVACLKSGESHTMAGGWFGIPSGHDMIYRFERTSSNTFNIYIYDAQEGSEASKGGQEREGRKRSHPYILLEGVQWKELFFCEEGQSGNPVLFENLLSLNVPQSVPKAHSRNSVLACFAHVQPRRVTTDKLPALFISMQRSGNCSVKSMDCLTLDLLQDPHAYKKISLDVRLLPLITYYCAFKDKLSKDPFQRDVGLFQLREATKNFLRVLDKNFRRPDLAIGQEEYTIACATAHHLLKEVDEWEESLKSTVGTPHQLKATYNQTLASTQSQARIKKAATLPQMLKATSEKRALDTPAYHPLLGHQASWANLGSVLSQLNGLISQLKGKENKQNLIFQIEITLRNLSHLKDFPTNMQAKEAAFLLSQLSHIQEEYTQIISKRETASPSAQTTAMEFLALSYCLAVAADQDYGILQHFGVETNFFLNLAIKDRLFTIQDPLLLQQRNKLECFFQKQSSKLAAIFNLDTLKLDEKKFLNGKTPEGLLYRSYLNNPTLAQAFLALAPTSTQPPIYRALEGFKDLSESKLPSQLRHLHLLKLSSAYAHGTCGRGKLELVNVNCTVERANHLYFMTKFYVWNTGEEPTLENSLLYQASLKDFSPNQELHAYASHNQSAHTVSNLNSENQLLAKEEANPDLDFYLALSEPGVQTSALLDAIERNLHRLAEEKMRRSLQHMLIKLIKTDQGLISPLIESLEEEPFLLTKFERLIALGKKNFIDTKPKHSPQLDEMLFLIRQYARALQIVKSLHPQHTYSSSTLQLVEELTTYLNEVAHSPTATAQMRSEIQLAKVGLLLGMPLNTQSKEQSTDLFYSMLDLKNVFDSFPTSSDPSFWKESQRLFFNSQEWTQLLNNRSQRKAFANGLMNKVGQQQFEHWEFEEGRLYAKDSSNEKWTIDIQNLSIRNAKGDLVQKSAPLEKTPSFERLFSSKTYDLQFFGEEIWFKDPVWGQIKVIGKGKDALIQRQIKNKWYTYIPNDSKYKNLVEVNEALFYDHALWFDPNSPQDIHFCDLQTGQTLYHLERDGNIYDIQSGKLFSKLQEKDYPLLERFESIAYINGWIDPKQCSRKEGNEVIAFSRFCSTEGQPLQFFWEEETQSWKYPQNPTFSIDTNPDRYIGFQVSRFLPLISQDKTKQKILIPRGLILSKGFSPLATVHLHDSTLAQKGTLTFFEYDLAAGQVIPQSLDAKIYLAHLYLAQKNYQQALALIKSISLSEQPSKTTIALIEKFLLSATNLHDHSPNAHAVRLFAYQRFQTLNPFLSYVGSDPSKVIEIMQGYHIYLDGLNNLENPLKMGLEEEEALIAFFKKALETLKEDEATKSNFKIEGFQAELRQRELTLKGQQLPKKTFFIDTRYRRVEGQDALPLCFNYFSDSVSQRQVEANNYFSNQASQTFLSRFEDFSRCYEILRNHPPGSFEYQAFFYELATAQILRGIDDNRLRLLSLVAQYQKLAPELPPLGSPSYLTLKWYEQLKELYDRSKRKAEPQILPILHKKLESFSFHLPNSGIREEQPAAPFNQKAMDVGSKPPLEKRQALPPLFVRESQDALFESWQNKFLEPQKAWAAPAPLSGKAPLQKLEAKEVSDKKYQRSLQSHVDFYAQDCQIARAKNDNKRVFNKGANCEELLSEMLSERETAAHAEKKLTSFVTQLANKEPAGLDPFVAHLAHQLGQARKKHTLESVLRAACQKDSLGALRQLNPHLEEKEANTLRSACLELMVETTHRQHLQRVIQPLEKWVAGGKSQDVYLEEAQEALSEGRGYNPKTSAFPLLFEYFSGLRVRPKQAHLIDMVFASLFASQQLGEKQEELIGKVFQLIMAGGKTSVILSLLVEMVSEAGLLACVMSHHSQMASVKGSLADFQSKRFAKDIYVLDYTIQDLSKPEVLDLILKRLGDADRKACALVMKTTLPQLLELKFIIELLRLRNTKTAKERQELGAVIGKLRKINKIFSDKGVGFFDESDITLSMLLDVIIPLGQPKSVKPERAGIVNSIFEHLVGNDEMLKLISLQNELSTPDLEKKILPFIADKMFSHSPLKLYFKPELKAAFERFVCGQITPEEQALADKKATSEEIFSSEEQAQNVAFLRYLQTLASSNNRYEQEAAHLISLVRQVSLKVLRLSLSRAYNRGYGKDLSNDTGKIIPYLAARAPATTQFGNIYLALAYQAQAAINDTLSKGEVSFLAKKMAEAANYYAHKEKVAFEDTLEAQQFLELTSVRLSDISSAEHLEQALAYLNDPEHSTRRLAFAAELAPFHVHYHKQKAGSNAINGVSAFNKAVADSATLWNHSTYHSGFGAPALDEGTEGSILNLLTERAEKNPNCIHSLADTTLDDFLKVFHQHPNKQKLRGLADGGGFLKAYSNEVVAQAFMQFFAEEETQGGPPIEGVVYLHKFSADEAKKMGREEAFMLLKKGQTKPLLLSNPSTEEIEKLGVKKEHLFVLFDELRTTGTNILVDDSALFLNTVDHKMPVRSFLQEVLRARGIFKGQQAEYLVTDKGRAEMINGGKTFLDLKDTVIKNEALMLKDQQDRSRLAQIDNVVRSAIMKELLQEEDIDKLEALIDNYQTFLTTTFEDNPYEQFGRIRGRGKAIEILADYAKWVLDRFQRTASPSFSVAQEKMEALLKTFKKNIAADEEMDLTFHDDLEATVELEQEQELNIELEQEQEIELNQELQTELNSYRFDCSATPYQERSWNLNAKDPLWEQLQPGLNEKEPRLFPVSEVLSRTYLDPQSKEISTAAYAPCFPENLFMTENFYRTLDEELPIFHQSCKRAGFVLAVEREKGAYQFILVSEQEAGNFKRWLDQTKSPQAHLLDLNGIPEINTEIFNAHIKQKEFLFDQFLQGLWHANFFNGNISFLEQHVTMSRQLIDQKEALMARFLQLRVANNKQSLRQLFMNDLFNLENASATNSQSSGLLFSKRRAAIEQKYNQTRKWGREKIASLPAIEVENIAPHQAGWLTTKEQIFYLPPHLINDLLPSQIDLLPLDKISLLTKPELIQAIHTKEQERHLINNQLKHLLPDQVPLVGKERLREVPDSVIQGLKDVRQIQRIKGKRVQVLLENQVNAIEEEEIKNLTPSQVSWLSRPELVKAVDPSQVHWIKKENRVHIDKIDALLALPDGEALKDNQVRMLKRYFEEKEKLTEEELKPWQVPYLPKERISLLQTPSLICRIPLEYAREITPKQAQSLRREDKELIANLTSTALKGLDPSLCDLLTAEQIGQLELPAHQEIISRLDAKQATHLNTAALQGIALDIVHDLNDQDIKRLENPLLLLSLDEDQARQLTEKQKEKLKQHLATHHLSLEEEQLKPWQVPYLPKERISKLESSKLIRSIPLEYASEITREQAGHLNIDSGALINQLTPSALPGISIFLTKQLRDERIRQFELPRDQEMISRLQKDYHIAHLSDAALQGIHPDIIPKLSSQNVTRLENPLLLLSLDKDQAKQLTEKQKDKLKQHLATHHLALKEEELKPWQVPYLPKERISQLKTPKLVRSIPLEYASEITREQAGYLKIDNEMLINQLTPSALPGISIFLTERLRNERIRQFELPQDQEMISRLRKAYQIAHLNDAALQGIHPAIVYKLSSQDIKRLENPLLLLSLEEDQARQLTEKQKDKLKQHLATHHLSLKEEQLQPWQVPYLPKERLRLLKTRSLICRIPLEYAAEITPEQAQCLRREDRELIANLTSTALQGLDPSLCDLLTAEQIGQLELPAHRDIIFRLDARQATHLNPAALQGIHPVCVNGLSDRDVKRLREPHLLLALDEEHLTKIEQEQEEILSRAFERLTTREDISRLRDDLLKFLPAPQIPLVSANKAFCLAERQWAHLSKQQVEEVKARMAARITQEFVNALSSEALEALSQEQAVHLRAERVSELGERHASLIRGIQSDRLLSHLSETALQLIAPEQLSRIGEANFQRIQDPELLFHAPAHCSAWLTPDQRVSLEQAIVRKAPDSVPDHHLSYLSDSQIQNMQNKAKIRQLPGIKKAQLTAHQVSLFEPREMTPEFVRDLGKEGLQAFNEPSYAACYQALTPQQLASLSSAHVPLIQRLSSDKLQHLSIQSLQRIAATQVPSLSLTDLDRLLERDLLLAIPEERYQELSLATKARLTQAINALDDPSILQARHLHFLQPHSPAFRALRNPALLVQLEPPLFSHLTNEQLSLLRGHPLQCEQVQSLSVDQFPHLEDPYIAFLSPAQIAQLTDANQREVALLSEEQIQQMALFPAHLIPQLTPEALRHLNPNHLNLEQVPLSQRIHLSDLQLSALYVQPGDRLKHLAQGLLFPLFFLPKLAGQFLFNALLLATSAYLGLFSASWRRQAKWRAEETFIHAPIRTFAGFWILFDYIKYKRMQLEHGGN